MEPGSRYFVEYAKFERVAQKHNQNTPLHVWNEKMCIEWLHERQARIRKTVAVTFLIWPAFSYFFRFIWSGNQGRQHKCPSHGNADRMAGTYECYEINGQRRTLLYAKAEKSKKISIRRVATSSM